jgi:phospholipid N-methyltransferase
MGFLGRQKSGVVKTRLKYPFGKLVSLKLIPGFEKYRPFEERAFTGAKLDGNSKLRAIEWFQKYNFLDTRITDLLREKPKFGELIISELVQMARKARDSKERIRMLDWGCGFGSFLKSINDYFENTPEAQGISKIQKYGFTIDGYPEIHETIKADPSLKIAHTDIESFERWLKAVRRKGLKFDLIFSHYGLRHLEMKRNSHYIELLKSLTNDGKLIIFPSIHSKLELGSQEYKKLERKFNELGFVVKNVDLNTSGPFTIIQKAKSD